MATIKSSQSAKAISNIAALGSSEIISQFVAFIGLTCIARTLGPERFGIIRFTFILCGCIFGTGTVSILNQILPTIITVSIRDDNPEQ